MLGTSSLRTIAEVLLPASFPSIVAGLRVGAGLGWQSLVGAELIVASAGVGYMMVQGQSNISTPTVMAGMLAIGLVGLMIDVALRQLEARVRRRRGLA
jgi:NitT/TauT family transport system permease protein